MLFGCLFALVVVLSLLTIVATHKIAGPAYKMKKLFGEVEGRQLQLRAKLRKGDELDDIFLGIKLEMMMSYFQFQNNLFGK